ncbi:hypothetical protein HF086_010173 [Spodoptera exigua]|uniref:Uncharacterized protein n=1 Tax=Spodoptera exigua TaxID=7107 RepID=A0A922SD80_SPOEX|nr:hypothetical protein HF086_010173 [Spodoptera exigua]
MTNVSIPTLAWTRDKGITIIWFPLFKLFPVLLTIVIMWALCAILTATGVFPPEHPARTDVKLNIIEDAPWFRVPYPAAPPPPLHAINRGLGTEGLGTVLAGLWGSGNGTNTFGENVGAIGVTKVGSRRVVQWAAGLMVVQGVVGKLGAVFIIIPQPIVGGLFCVMFGMISAFGTDEERGLAAWAKEMSLDAAGASEEGDTYDFPIGMGLIRRWKWTQYLPFMPTYQAGKFTALFTKKEN